MEEDNEETKGLTEEKLLRFTTDHLSKNQPKNPSERKDHTSIKKVKVSYGTCKSFICSVSFP